MDSSQLEIPGRFSTNRNSAISNLAWNATAFVDPTNGHNATAVFGDAAAPYRDPFAAAHAASNYFASTGQRATVWLRPGIYLTNDICRNGVDYWCQGAQLRMPPGATKAFFHPQGTATTNTIYFADMYSNEELTDGFGTYGIALLVSNSASQITFHGGRVFAGSAVLDSNARGFLVWNCSNLVVRGMDIDCRAGSLDTPIAAFDWAAGNLTIDSCNVFADAGGVLKINAARNTNGPGEVAIMGGRLIATHESVFNAPTDCASNCYVVTVKASYVRGHGNPCGIAGIKGGTWHLDAGRFEIDTGGDSGLLSGWRYADSMFNVGGNARVYISGQTYQTVVSRVVGVENNAYVEIDGGHILESNSSLPALNVTNGTLVVKNVTITKTNGIGCFMEGGTLKLINTTVDTSRINRGTNWPVVLSAPATTLILQNSVLIGPAAATNVIQATDAQDVRSYGGFGNKQTNNFVTILVGPWTVDSNVQ